jgi:hypothetical protein
MLSYGSNYGQAQTTWAISISNPTFPNLPDSLNVTFSSFYLPGHIFAASPATYSFYGASAANGSAIYQMGGLNSNSYVEVIILYNIWYPADANHPYFWNQLGVDTLHFTTTCIPLNITAFANTTNICSGSSVVLSTNGNGGTITWRDGNGNIVGYGSSITVYPTSTTTFNAVETNGSCTSNTASVTITVNSSSSLSVSSASYSICSGGNVQFQASGGNSYQWTPSTGLNNPNIANPFASPSVTTTYTVTDPSSSCGSGSKTVTVNVTNSTTLNISASNQNICSGSFVTLSETNGVNCTWKDGSGTIVGTGTFVIVNPTGTTTYTATPVNTTCNSSSTSMTINVLQSSVLNLVAPSTACVGSSITLSVSGGNGNYTWVGDGLTSTTGSTVTAIPTTGNPNSFYTVSSYGGCTSSASTSIAVNGTQGSVSLSSNIYNICHNSNNSVILTGTPAGGTFIGNGVNFLVNYPGYSEAIFNPDQAGGNGPITLSYILNSGNVCSSQDNVIVNVLPSPAGTDYWYISGNGGGQFVLNGQGFPHCTVRIGSYTYVPTTQSSSQIVLDNLPTDVNLVEGLFFTIVPDDPNECSFTFQIVFTIGIKEISSGSSNGNVVTSSTFDDVVRIKLKPANWKVSLSDIRGREIKKFSVDGDFELKNEGFMPGMYFLSATDGEHTAIVKLLKQ